MYLQACPFQATLYRLLGWKRCPCLTVGLTLQALHQIPCSQPSLEPMQRCRRDNQAQTGCGAGGDEGSPLPNACAASLWLFSASPHRSLVTFLSPCVYQVLCLALCHKLLHPGSTGPGISPTYALPPCMQMPPLLRTPTTGRCPPAHGGLPKDSGQPESFLGDLCWEKSHFHVVHCYSPALLLESGWLH